jgi:hypothetical protein
MNYIALLVAVLGVISLIQMLRTGSGSPNGVNFRRDEQPGAYWSIFFVIVLVIMSMLYFTLSGTNYGGN